MCLKKKVCTILYPRGHLHSTLLNHQCIALLIVFPMPLHNIPGNDGIDLDSRICKCGPLRVNNSIVYSSSAVRLCNKGRDAIGAKKLTGEISASGVATPRCVCNSPGPCCIRAILAGVSGGAARAKKAQKRYPRVQPNIFPIIS